MLCVAYKANTEILNQCQILSMIIVQMKYGFIVLCTFNFQHPNKNFMYTTATLFVNLTNSTDKQQLVPEMVELAKYAKQHIPEEHPKVTLKWAAPCKNLSLGICRQQRPRSACASAQSDQGLHCMLTESLDTTECKNGEQRP